MARSKLTAVGRWQMWCLPRKLGLCAVAPPIPQDGTLSSTVASTRVLMGSPRGVVFAAVDKTCARDHPVLCSSGAAERAPDSRCTNPVASETPVLRYLGPLPRMHALSARLRLLGTGGHGNLEAVTRRGHPPHVAPLPPLRAAASRSPSDKAATVLCQHAPLPWLATQCRLLPANLPNYQHDRAFEFKVYNTPTVVTILSYINLESSTTTMSIGVRSNDRKRSVVIKQLECIVQSRQRERTWPAGLKAREWLP